MTTPRDSEQPDARSLRERAEQRIAERVQARVSPSGDADLQRLVHELQVHEIELAMQNEALRASHAEVEAERARYVDLYDFAPMGYLTLSRDGVIREANLSAARMLGITRNALLRGLFRHHVQLADRHLLEACLVSAGAEPPLASCEVRLADPSLLTRAVHIECVAAADDATVRVSLLDITARRAAEEALLLRDRAMRVLTHGIVITDPNTPDNPIIYVNAGFEAMTGYPAHEAIGRNCRFLQGVDTDPETVRVLRAAVAAGAPCDVEILNYRRSGEPYWCALSLTPVRDTDGRLVQFIGVQVDISERRMLERAVGDAQRLEAVGRLAGGIAHDFSNVLTIINGCAEVLQQQLRQHDPLRQVAREIEEANARATMLTRQLVAFSRRQVITMHTLDLSALVTETASMLRPVIGEDIDLCVESTSPTASVRADSALLEQMLVNLVLHSREAMPHGGRITLRTDRVLVDEAYRAAHNEIGDLYHASQRQMQSGPYIVLSLSDTGVGMDAGTAERIFKPFLDTQNSGERIGLGLSMVYGVVQRCHGYITVDSEPAVGTTFRILLPEVAPAPAAPVPEPLEPMDAVTILLVEDDPSVRRLATQSLRAAGHEVLEAGDGIDALRIAGEHHGPIDLLLTDVVMPNMGGRALAETLRQSRPATRVLFMSGYPDDEVLRRGVQQDQIAFLEKPFTQSVLGAKVREVLETPLARRGT